MHGAVVHDLSRKNVTAAGCYTLAIAEVQKDAQLGKCGVHNSCLCAVDVLNDGKIQPSKHQMKSVQ